MKKRIILVVVVFLSITMHAQNHLSFKGVPIDGSMCAFVQALEAKGLSKQTLQGGTATLTGSFAGRDATINVYASSDKVFKVSASYDTEAHLSEIENIYNDLKSMLTRKYGSPTTVTEDVNTSRADVVSYLPALMLGQLTWQSIWQVNHGTIVLQVVGDDLLPTVRLTYEDKANAQSAKSEYLDEL